MNSALWQQALKLDLLQESCQGLFLFFTIYTLKTADRSYKFDIYWQFC